MQNEAYDHDAVNKNDAELCKTYVYKTILSTWTIDALKQYFDEKIGLLEEKTKERFLAAKENISIALLASEKAIVKAETANDKRFDSVNEFRGTLSDQTKNLVSRTEYLVQHQNLIEKIDSSSLRLADFESRASALSSITTAVHNQVGINTNRLQVIETKLQTQQEGLSKNGAIIMSVIVAIGTMLNIAALLWSFVK